MIQASAQSRQGWRREFNPPVVRRRPRSFGPNSSTFD